MIRKIIAENLRIDIDSIKGESKFVEDLGADSLNIVEVVMAIEEEFEIEIPDEDAEGLQTVAQLEKYIEDNS
jgi:acyl carrier protein